MATKTDAEQQLPLVRRGYDPYEVQRLVGSLSSELKVLAVANDELRGRLADLERERQAAAAASAISAETVPAAMAPPTPPAIGDDETVGHRHRPADPSVESARLEAAQVLAAAEREGNIIRQRARIDADRIVELAHQRAEEIARQHSAVADQLRSTQAQIARLVAMLDRPSSSSDERA